MFTVAVSLLKTKMASSVVVLVQTNERHYWTALIFLSSVLLSVALRPLLSTSNVDDFFRASAIPCFNEVVWPPTWMSRGGHPYKANLAQTTCDSIYVYVFPWHFLHRPNLATTEAGKGARNVAGNSQRNLRRNWVDKVAKNFATNAAGALARLVLVVMDPER